LIFRVKFLKKEIDNVLHTLGSSDGFPKKEISGVWHCHFRKYLLTVGVDEQQEIAISPLILNVSVACFLEHIPYMYIHPSTMLECKKCEFVSVRM
jgi:hypothetical protein